MEKKQERIVRCDEGEIRYLLERKRVKNLNLRVYRDGRVYVSASPAVPVRSVDEFVRSREKFIRSAQQRFFERAACAPKLEKYENGESFRLLGREVRLKVERGEKDAVSFDGAYLRLSVRNPEDPEKRKKLAEGYLKRKCRVVFGEIMAEILPGFREYGISMPALRVRSMRTRWGSCSPAKGAITLNRRLLEAPRSCIEYVVMHEFCHFIHPDHSKRFYAQLTARMPDWKERKALLERSVAF